MSCPDDDTIAAFVEGSLAEAAAHTVEEHVDGCPTCRSLLAELGRQRTRETDAGGETGELLLVLARGDAVGRYLVLEQIGSGGMGVVYAAYDPKLDRKIALKVIRPGATLDEDSSGAQARLLREAQALARLSHPNVVTVFDVQTVGGHVVVAMEYIDGVSLRTWLKESRPWPEVVAVLGRAGRGLQAAHQAGLVHRDFKPDNVMLGAGGAVRVLDFGLARAARTEEVVAAPRRVVGAQTVTGAVMGTPAYMAPEQRRGEPTDERSDQFSFCVALYEALFAAAPFSDWDDPSSLQPAPKATPVPLRVRRAIERGLAADPADRWPTLAALLDELTRDPSTRRRQIGLVAGAVLAAGIAIVAVVVPRADPCPAPRTRLEEVWNQEARDELRSTFLGGGAPFAQQTLATVAQQLDQHAAAWLDAHRDACRATHVHQRQSEALLDVRMACLEQHRVALGATVAALVAAGPEVVASAATIVAGLEDPEVCRDIESLLAPAPLPGDASAVAEIADLRATLPELEVQARVGEYGAALRRIDELAVRADRIGYAPVTAEVHLTRGRALLGVQEYSAAEDALVQSLLAAERGRHRAVSTRAAIELVHAGGYRYGKRRAYLFDALAAAKIEGHGGEVESLQLERIENLASALLGRLEPFAAREVLSQASARFESHYGPRSLGYADFAYAFGEALAQSEQFVRARKHYQVAFSIWEEKLGPGHPLLLKAHQDIGFSHYATGDTTVALEHYSAAQAIAAELGRADAQLRVLLRAQVGEAMSFDHDRERGFAELRAAVKDSEAELADTWVVGHTHNLLGGQLARWGRYREARPHIERAVRVFEREVGPDTLEVGYPVWLLGRLDLEDGRLEDARAHFERVVAILEARDPEASMLAHPWTGLGEVRLAEGDAVAALEVLERAVAVRGDNDAYYGARAVTGFAMARAMVAAHRDRARARELARAALASLTVESDLVLRQRIGKWLARH